MNRNIYVIFLSLAFCLIACRQYPHIQPLLQETETLMGKPAGQFFNPFRVHPVPRKTLRGRLCHLVSTDDAGAG